MLCLSQSKLERRTRLVHNAEPMVQADLQILIFEIPARAHLTLESNLNFCVGLAPQELHLVALEDEPCAIGKVRKKTRLCGPV